MRKLTTKQQDIVDAVAAGAQVVLMTWTQTSERGRTVSMRRRERYELRRKGHEPQVLRADTVQRLFRHGLILVAEDHADDRLERFVVALRDGNTETAHEALQEAFQ